MNAPYVDNSHKWGGGGFMSTVEDLVQFGNSMLYAKQMGDTKNTTGLKIRALPHTVEPRFNAPLYNEVLGITNGFLQPGQNFSKMYGTEPRYNETRFNEILVITNTIQKPKRKIYLDIMNRCQHVMKD